MLVTLELIAINVYSSVDGPSLRGFSLIELWSFGVQFPILMSIFEYGVILAIKRLSRNKTSMLPTTEMLQGKGTIMYSKQRMDMEQLSKKIDVWACFTSLGFTLIFNVVYWRLAFQP